MSHSTPEEVNNQKALANAYCGEIDDYIKKLEPIVSKGERISESNDRWTLLSIILPVVLAPTSSLAAILSEYYWITLLNIFNAVFPVLIKLNKNKLSKYNACTDLSFKLTRLKGQVTSLALKGTLKGKELEEIDDTIKTYNELLIACLQITT